MASWAHPVTSSITSRPYPIYLPTIYSLFQAGSLLSRVGWGWVGGWVVLFRFKASLSSTGTWLPTGTELGNKSTFFTGTLKVWENKVVLLFSFLASRPRYCPYLLWSSLRLWKKSLLRKITVLELLKIKRLVKKNNWFSTFFCRPILTPPKT